MPIHFNTPSLKLLLRQFEKGNVVLFAGAGFSLGAKNLRGTDPPLGPQLAEILASVRDAYEEIMRAYLMLAAGGGEGEAAKA